MSPFWLIGLVAFGLLAPGASEGRAQQPASPPSAPSGPEIDPAEIPSVHNTFYAVPEGAVSWDTLAALEVKAEVLGPLRTQFTTSYSEPILALDGEHVRIMGFIYPLEGGREHRRFLLTAWPPSCPFCLPAGPAQMVEVEASEPVPFTEGAILIAGDFEVLEDDPSGMYYRMTGAKLLERFDDIRWPG